MVPTNAKALKEFRELKDFFWMPETLCLCIGIDINQRYPRRKTLLWLATACGTVMHIYVLWLLAVVLLNTRDRLVMWSALDYFAYELDMVVKLLGLLICQGRLRSLYQALEQNYPTKREEREIYRINEDYAKNSKPIFIIGNMVAMLIITFEPILKSSLQYAYRRLFLHADQVVFTYLKPIPIVYAYDHHSPGFYVLYCTLEVLVLLFSVGTIFGSDMWLIALMNQMCLHFQYIARRLRDYQPSMENQDKDCQFLAKLVEKHRAILEIQNKLNATFGTTILLYFLNCCGLICFVLFQLTFLDWSARYVKLLIFLVTINLKIFAMCRYGQKVITTSTSIAEAAYMSSWPDGSQTYRKLILILIIRAQKAAALSAIGFQSISMPTFQMVLSMSYKVFALLQSTVE